MINSASASDLGSKVVSLNSEIQLKTSELRQEMTRRFSEMSSHFTDLLIKKASNEEVRILSEEKIDLNQVKHILGQHRVNVDSDLEILRSGLNRFTSEI
jgi:hypothetical protein